MRLKDKDHALSTYRSDGKIKFSRYICRVQIKALYMTKKDSSYKSYNKNEQVAHGIHIHMM